MHENKTKQKKKQMTETNELLTEQQTNSSDYHDNELCSNPKCEIFR